MALWLVQAAMPVTALHCAMAFSRWRWVARAERKALLGCARHAGGRGAQLDRGRGQSGESACHLTVESLNERVDDTLPLGALLDAYTVEAEAQLCEVLAAMKSRWP